MSLSPRHIAVLQKAGQAVHAASESIAAAVQSQAEGMVASLATRPFAVESEQALSQFRTLAQLGQQLIAVEVQMQALYATAAELARPESDVVIALPKKIHDGSAAQAEDVVAKPARVGKTTPPTKKTMRREGNDAKLLHFLNATLNSHKAIHITGAALAKGADMPLGSVAASLRKLLALGKIKQGPAGHYQLAK